MEKRLAAILISDIVGYTKLMEGDTEGTVIAWSGARDNVIEPQIDAANGRLVKFMGDGFLAEFSTVQTALECAIEIQNGVRDNALKFRMAIHLGDIIDDGKDIYGEGINIAARLEGVAEPGGICISGDVYNQVRNRISADYEDIGPQEVKNVAEPIQAYAVKFEKMLGREKNGPETSKLEIPSIAVLPFDNMSGDPEQEYFTDGIVEDIITELSFIENLRVIARNSSFAYKGQSPDIRAVGDALDVGHVLEGSVRKVGNNVRITAQLIVTSDNSHRWAKRYDGTLENIFELQTEISQKIAEELNLEFSSLTDVSVGEEAIKKKEAHDIARRGRAVGIPPSERNIAASKRYYQRAIDVDNNCAMAYAGLGHCDVITAWHFVFDAQPRNKLFKSGTALAQKAMDIDPNLALPYVSVMMSLLLQNANDEALEVALKAVKQCPNSPEAHVGLGLINTVLENFEDAISSIETAIDLDPLNRTFYLSLIGYYCSIGKFDEAVKIFEREFEDAVVVDLPLYAWCLILPSYIKIENYKIADKLHKEIMDAFPNYSGEKLLENGSVTPRSVFEDLINTIDGYLPSH